MENLKGYQKKYLRGLAHSLKPVVIIGQSGLSDSVIKAVDESLDKHELIKVKFNEFKEKDQKTEIMDLIKKKTGCEMAGKIGHTAIFYRQHKDAEKRNINLPVKNS